MTEETLNMLTTLVKNAWGAIEIIEQRLDTLEEKVKSLEAFSY